MSRADETLRTMARGRAEAQGCTTRAIVGVRYNRDVLFFEFFPAFVMIAGGIVAVALYVWNRTAPDETAARARRRREVEERAARARARGDLPATQVRRPSMRP